MTSPREDISILKWYVKAFAIHFPVLPNRGKLKLSLELTLKHSEAN